MKEKKKQQNLNWIKFFISIDIEMQTKKYLLNIEWYQWNHKTYYGYLLSTIQLESMLEKGEKCFWQYDWLSFKLESDMIWIQWCKIETQWLSSIRWCPKHEYFSIKQTCFQFLINFCFFLRIQCILADN